MQEKSFFSLQPKWSLTKASSLFTGQSVARDTSLIVFSSWSPGSVFQEKGSYVVFRRAPHRRLGLQKSTVHQVNLPAGFFTLKACIRCARSWWQPGPRPLVCPHQSSFSSEALQQQEVQRRTFRQLMLWRTATNWLFHRQTKRGVKKKKLQSCSRASRNTSFLLFRWLMLERQQHVVQTHHMLTCFRAFHCVTHMRLCTASVQTSKQMCNLYKPIHP